MSPNILVITNSNFKKMEEKDLNLIVEKLEKSAGEKITLLMDDVRKGLITPGQFADGIKDLATAKEVKALADSMDQLAVDIKKMRTEHTSEKTIAQMLYDQKDAFEAMQSGKSDAKVRLDIKTAVTSSLVGSSALSIVIPGTNIPANELPNLRQLFTNAPIGANSGGVISYLDQTSQTRAAAGRAENVAAAESAIAWTRRTKDIVNISDSIPVTKESLLNFDFMATEIRRFLDINMALAENHQIYSGAGTTEMIGVATATHSTAFLPASMQAKAITDGTIYDLVNYLASYISRGAGSKYAANYCLMNSMDLWGMLSVKDDLGNYVVPPFVRVMGNLVYVGSVLIIPSNEVTAGTLTIGDFRQGVYYNDPSWEVTFGLVNTDFTQNRVTMLANKRAALLVKTLDITSFYRVTDIDAAVTGLATKTE
jgi:HK97 family phage major capsid protein